MAKTEASSLPASRQAAHQAILSGVALNVASPQTLAEFYTGVLGMTATPEGAEIRVAYGGAGAYLALRQSPSPRAYRHEDRDRYWKIGITLPDLDAAHAQLERKGVAVGTPRQFGDVGYLCHLADPEGFRIELLQRTFEGEPRTAQGDDSLPLGGGAALGQITLRTGNIGAELDHFERRLGMKLLSRQPIAERDFDLYFLACTDEEPPDSDLTAVHNRPWLWQRPYTTLEFQHWPAAGPRGFGCRPGETGYAGLIFE